MTNFYLLSLIVQSFFEDDIIVYDYTNGDNVDEAISHKNFMWPVVDGLVRIPYEITLRITPEKQQNITRAMNEYSEKTCVR